MNTFFTLNHPQANTISIVPEMHDGYSVEVAFFKNEEWVVDKIEDWEEHPDGWFDENSTLVYRYVPVANLQAFLKKYLA